MKSKNLLRNVWLLCCTALGISGCATTPLNDMERSLDADSCLRDMTAELLGQSHEALSKRMTGDYEWRKFRKRGYRYDGSISIVQDGEHPPDGLLVVIGVSDGEKTATIRPSDRMFSVLPGQVLVDEKTPEEQRLHHALTGRWQSTAPDAFLGRILDLRADGTGRIELPSGKMREGKWFISANRWLALEFGDGRGRNDILTAQIDVHNATSLRLVQTGVYVRGLSALYSRVGN